MTLWNLLEHHGYRKINHSKCIVRTRYIMLKIQQLSKQFSVLYAEDDRGVCAQTKLLLELLFKEVYVANNGVEALDTYIDYFDKNDKYIDIIISDIEMPNMNGIELCKKIIEYDQNQKILITSAYDDKKYLIELINIGVNGFMQKPLSRKHIINELYDVCLKLSQERKLQRNIVLSENCSFNIDKKKLLCDGTEVTLSEAERRCMALFLQGYEKNQQDPYTALEIFEYVYPVEKVFSSDAIKSLIKRLRKKLPKNCIGNIPNKGYYINFV